MFQPIANQVLPDEPTVLAVGCGAATCQMLKTALRPFGFAVEWYSSLEEFIEGWESPRRGCVFLDLENVKVGPSGIMRQLAGRWIYLPVVLLASRGAPRGDPARGDVAEAVRAIRCGAFDFIPKPWSAEQLAEAADEALKWEAAHHAAIVDRARIERRLARLDERERQVLAMMVEGMSSKAISSLLGLSTRAVENRRKSLMAKMRARNPADLLRQAIAASQWTGPLAAKVPVEAT
jgi:two-component system response regulator FixJ